MIDQPTDRNQRQVFDMHSTKVNASSLEKWCLENDPTSFLRFFFWGCKMHRPVFLSGKILPISNLAHWVVDPSWPYLHTLKYWTRYINTHILFELCYFTNLDFFERLFCEDSSETSFCYDGPFPHKLPFAIYVHIICIYIYYMIQVWQAPPPPPPNVMYPSWPPSPPPPCGCGLWLFLWVGNGPLSLHCLIMIDVEWSGSHSIVEHGWVRPNDHHKSYMVSMEWLKVSPLIAWWNMDG